MKEMQLRIDINTTQQKVWDTLWQDKTFKLWADLVDPGTYMVGDLLEGNTVQFISAEGYGVTSFIAKLIPNEYVLFKHLADTQDDGMNIREDQWTGGAESYTLRYQDGITTLVMSISVPVELEKTVNESYLRALRRVKELSENRV